MRHHGATVVGGDLRELVSRSIFMCQNAVYQLQAQLLGKVAQLSLGETRLAGSLNALPNVVGRTWEYSVAPARRGRAVAAASDRPQGPATPGAPLRRQTQSHPQQADAILIMW